MASAPLDIDLVVATQPHVDINVLCEGIDNATLLSSDESFLTRYELGEELGRGGWARVYATSLTSSPLATPTPSMPLAVKVIDKVSFGRKLAAIGRTRASDVQRVVDRMRAECRVLSELNHPHVVQLFELCESPQNLFMVMERALGGALLERIISVGLFTEPDALHIMRQLLDVLQFMHRRGVVHRDGTRRGTLDPASTHQSAKGVCFSRLPRVSPWQSSRKTFFWRPLPAPPGISR